MKDAINHSNKITVPPGNVIRTLKKHMQAEGFPVVVDLEESQGSRLVDAATGKSYLDFFTFFATSPLGFNHPRLMRADAIDRLAGASVNNPANSHFFTMQMAEFAETFEQYAMPDDLPLLFLISGGALAVENALKTAFDWKVRKNFLKGAIKETGTQVIHFREAFHGRSGYTLSLTNTNPAKTDYFPKFEWPRITNPKMMFPAEAFREEILAAEERAKLELKEAILRSGDDIAALIIEPIQGEGGDNHFRHEFMQFLREITEENEILFIVDEVQTGVGATGKMWAYEHSGMTPDIVAFGKKMQVCGIMVSEKVNEVDSVFKIPSRINSTWGGSLTDMVRATYYLQIIHEENLVENARVMGAHLLDLLKEVSERNHGLVKNVRGQGLMLAFDLPDANKRKSFLDRTWGNGLIIGPCGTRSVRFRPPLNVTKGETEEGAAIVEKSLKQMV